MQCLQTKPQNVSNENAWFQLQEKASFKYLNFLWIFVLWIKWAIILFVRNVKARHKNWCSGKQSFPVAFSRRYTCQTVIKIEFVLLLCIIQNKFFSLFYSDFSTSALMSAHQKASLFFTTPIKFPFTCSRNILKYTKLTYGRRNTVKAD